MFDFCREKMTMNVKDEEKNTMSKREFILFQMLVGTGKKHFMYKL